MTTHDPVDLLIIGGGLSGGLIALACAQLCPQRKVLLIEEGESLGGNHVWSFFDDDMSAQGRTLLAPLVTYRWAGGHDVRFPEYDRTLSAPYNSITCAQFDAHLRHVMGKQALCGTKVASLTPASATLADGLTIRANAVIDARGLFFQQEETKPGQPGLEPDDLSEHLSEMQTTGPAALAAGRFRSASPLDALSCGWQKFVGLRLRLESPHGLTRPIIMDARVPQIDGYRFVYVLPTGEREIFVEDTYYSDGAALDVGAISARIEAYAAAQGWQIEAVLHRETGVLPVVIGGSFDAFWPRGDNVARAGVRAGLFHPTTGYSLASAVSLALKIAGMESLGTLGPDIRAHAAQHWRSGGYYRLLDTMLFRAATPKTRIAIFARFYRLPEKLIGRFYAGRSSAYDRLRILCGRPPVPIRAAMRALLNRKA